MHKGLRELDLVGVNAAILGAYLQHLRINHPDKPSQQDVADAIGVALRTVSAIEQGISLPSIENAFALADFYGVDINTFRKPPKMPSLKRGRPAKPKGEGDE